MAFNLENKLILSTETPNLNFKVVWNYSVALTVLIFFFPSSVISMAFGDATKRYNRHHSEFTLSMYLSSLLTSKA